MNPYEETYEMLLRTLGADPSLNALAEFVRVDIDDPETLGVSRRMFADAGKLRLAVIPRGGTLALLSSTTSEVREEYRIEAIGGALSLKLLWRLKWALLKALWADQSLGKDYITGVDVMLSVDESEIGTGAVDDGEGASVAWKLGVVIRVTMLFNRTALPVG